MPLNRFGTDEQVEIDNMDGHENFVVTITGEDETSCYTPQQKIADIVDCASSGNPPHEESQDHMDACLEDYYGALDFS